MSFVWVGELEYLGDRADVYCEARVEKQFLGDGVENLGTPEENGSEGIEFGDWEDVEMNWGLMDNSQLLPVEYAEIVINITCVIR